VTDERRTDESTTDHNDAKDAVQHIAIARQKLRHFAITQVPTSSDDCCTRLADTHCLVAPRYQPVRPCYRPRLFKSVSHGWSQRAIWQDV